MEDPNRRVSIDAAEANARDAAAQATGKLGGDVSDARGFLTPKEFMGG